MRIKLDEVTWYSRLITILFVLGILPAFVFYIGRQYQLAMNVLSYGKETALELHATGTYEQKAYAGDDSRDVEGNLKGDWINDQDPSYVLRIEEGNSFYDLYDGEPIASGAWVVRGSLKDTRFADLEKGLYLEKQSLSSKGVKEVLYYKIMFIDEKGLALKYLERGNLLSFKKTFSTSTIRSQTKKR